MICDRTAALTIAAAAELDRAGFLPIPGETPEDFFLRFKISEEHFEKLRQELTGGNTTQVFGEIPVEKSSIAPAEILAEASSVTRELYAFENLRVPAFFMSRNVGLLWGGCMIGDPDTGFAIMLLRSVFRRKNRWLFYNRRELLAHELCHAMRQSLNDPRLEEHFAYQTSPSIFRRTLGNCFIREWDAILFILPAFILLGATFFKEFFMPEFPIMPFWILTALYPAFLLLRNFRSRKVVSKAEKKLRSFGVEQTMPILFRCTFSELAAIGKLRDPAAFREYVSGLSRAELRWAVITKRFLPPFQGETQDETY